MKPKSEQRSSAWMTDSAVPEMLPMMRDAQADVCIVGAGIARLSTAYLLAREGKRVVVLDDGPIGGRQTQRTSAHLEAGRPLNQPLKMLPETPWKNQRKEQLSACPRLQARRGC